MIIDLDKWIEQEFTGHGVAVRREDETPIPGEPFMSMEVAKELTRRAAIEAAATIERLTTERDDALRTLWLVVYSNGGYRLERDHAEDFPGLDCAMMETARDACGDITLRAFVRASQQLTPETRA